LEDGHQSGVSARENRGETLAHVDVVRNYACLPAWDVRSRGELLVPAGHASRWIAVAGGRAAWRGVAGGGDRLLRPLALRRFVGMVRS